MGGRPEANEGIHLFCSLHKLTRTRSFWQLGAKRHTQAMLCVASRAALAVPSGGQEKALLPASTGTETTFLTQLSETQNRSFNYWMVCHCPLATQGRSPAHHTA